MLFRSIEEKMSADPDLAPILHALTETEQGDLIQVRSCQCNNYFKVHLNI